ncbi:8-oxo-dGTP diphosphatase MutT [Pseudoalteromonas sp. T1lg65]|uniref:8-oxo-dGTP diphosphatase MutT n=1 Tax=Pseudoalteromonas sp. T1lg65 TaxID=2077101 RepID=UPI003F79BC93
MNKKVVEVVVGVIKRNDEVFVCKRADNQHQGGLWEFPGGKVESGESVFAALYRELEEEIAIQIADSQELMQIEHDYGDKCVRLLIHVVETFKGEPHGAEGQPSQWVKIQKLDELAFPAANKMIIERLQQFGE